MNRLQLDETLHSHWKIEFDPLVHFAPMSWRTTSDTNLYSWRKRRMQESPRTHHHQTKSNPISIGKSSSSAYIPTGRCCTTATKKGKQESKAGRIDKGVHGQNRRGLRASSFILMMTIDSGSEKTAMIQTRYNPQHGEETAFVQGRCQMVKGQTVHHPKGSG
jgi:hypothetical protein